MNNLTLESLPNKFLPFLLGHASCSAPKNCKSEIDEIFTQSLKNAPTLKSDYIYNAGNWVLKGDRTGEDAEAAQLRSDTNIYRVRKANKIRNFIRANHLEQHVMVPQKFIYWDKTSQKFFVVAEKVDLSDEVASPQSDQVKEIIKQDAFLGGQALALVEGKSERDITPEQAKALAELSFLGLTDLSYNNMYFTNDGRIAIIDTEPLKRTIKKAMSDSWIPWFTDRDTWVMAQAIAGTAKLKMACADPEAIKAVEKVEKDHFLWNMAKLIGKIALAVLVFCLVPPLLAQLAIAGAIVTALQIAILGYATLKALGLLLSTLHISSLWSYSHDGIAGLVNIRDLELQGAC